MFHVSRFAFRVSFKLKLICAAAWFVRILYSYYYKQQDDMRYDFSHEKATYIVYHV